MASIKRDFSSFRKELEKYDPVEYYAKGKRSIVYICDYKGKKCAAKVERKDSGAINRLENEAKWLLVLNKAGIGPKLYAYGTDFIVVEFLEGERIVEWLSSANAKEAGNVLLDVFSQCMTLDKMLLTKEEMHHPVKHIIVLKGKATMIDFERCRKTEKPQNVTQFCQFLMSDNISSLLKAKGIAFDNENIIGLLKEYRADSSEKNYRQLLKAFGL